MTTLTNPKNLLPCPWPQCRGTPRLVHRALAGWNVECECGCSKVGDYETEEAAALDWNTRAHPTPPEHPMIGGSIGVRGSHEKTSGIGYCHHAPPEGVMSAEKLATVISYHVSMDNWDKAVEIIKARDAQLSQAKGEGWVLVPKELTEEMLNAARDWSIKKYNAGIGNDAARGCWQAMIAAAPQASDITKCPKCGGNTDNGFDRCDPPNPYICTKCQAPEEV